MPHDMWNIFFLLSTHHAIDLFGVLSANGKHDGILNYWTIIQVGLFFRFACWSRLYMYAFRIDLRFQQLELFWGRRYSSVGRSAVLTYLFRTGSSPARDKIFTWGKKSVGMYVVWPSPSGRGGFTGISRNSERCPGFPPPQAALRIILSNEGDAVYIDIDI